MIVEYLIRFCISLFDIGVFWHYMLTFRKKKNIPEPVCACVLILLATVWAQPDVEKNPYFNLLVLVAVLTLVTLLFEGRTGSRIASVAMFTGTGIVLEPVGMLMLYVVHYTAGESPIYLYYLVTALCAFIRGNVIFLLCRHMRRKELSLLKLPKEIAAVLVLVFAASVVNCCFVTILAMETDSIKSRFMCISIIGSIVLTYYFMLYMIERISIHVKRQQEDELYIEEMRYKEVYYAEAEKRNAYVQKLRHDMENRILGFYHLAVAGDTGTLLEQIAAMGRELGQADGDIYSSNPPVDTVLRFKLGAAKSEGIRVDTQIHIPSKMQVEYGDIGVLYGNLLDNAIEACRKAEGKKTEEKLYIKLRSFRKQNMFFIEMENSFDGEIKWGEDGLPCSTKEEEGDHGIGLKNIRYCARKYGGDMDCIAEGGRFTLSVMLKAWE